MHKFYFIIIILSIFSCKDQAKDSLNDQAEKTVDFQQYQWILGAWVDTNTFRNYNPSGHYIEKWLMHKDSIYGLGSNVIGYDTTITRYMSIRKLNNEFIFIERELGYSMISYFSTKLDSISFAFTNKTQTFPRDIIYNKKNKDSMTITLKGIAGEFDREIRMQFKKVGS